MIDHTANLRAELIDSISQHAAAETKIDSLVAERAALRAAIRAAAPPYVFPDIRPREHDSTREGKLWRVSGPKFTDGTGWNWEECFASELADGDVWVPIHMLHSQQNPELVERSRKLKEQPNANEATKAE